MGKALDIDIYKNGFDFRYIDCIQGPIAASTGYFKHDNYYYYCFLHSFWGNIENYFRKDLPDYSNKILNYFGLELNKIDCSGYTEDELVLRIIEEIQAERPVIFTVKYNSLFYHMYYKNFSFTTNHAVIINEFNENNCTFGIREATLLRDTIDVFENKDVFFPLHITFDMLKTIWRDSNAQFKKEEAFFTDSIYSLQKTGDARLNLNKIIQLAVGIMENNKNELFDVIKSFNGGKQFSYFIQVNRLRFSGSLKPIFDLLYKQCDSMKLDKTLTEKTEEYIKESREKVLNILNKASLKGYVISDERKADLCRLVKEGEERLITLLKSLLIDETGKRRTDHIIEINKYYNNQAFEQTLRDNSTADITGEGTHYIMQEVVSNEMWKKGDYCFYYSYTPGGCDNISCNGQIIQVENINANNISILGCAEFGNYSETIEIQYADGERYSIKADFSDFFQPPIFMENVFWAGPAAVRKDGKTVFQSFNSRLFAKDYQIRDGQITGIILPKRHNVHIFAITLYKEEWL